MKGPRLPRVSPRLVLTALLAVTATVGAAELDGRLAAAGVVAYAETDDAGYQAAGGHTFASDVESLRLMGSGALGASSQWNLHYQLVRRASDIPSAGSSGYTTLFRADPLRGELAGSADDPLYAYHEADWFNLRSRFSTGQLTVGRQPLSWGSGRIWQPFDIFGAFAPLELDTEYKPGIDAVVYDYFPSSFSSLSAAYVQTPLNSQADPGYALHYRRQAGEAELSLLAGRVMEYTLAGAGAEGSMAGAGVRLEGVAVKGPGDHDAIILIAGADYRLEGGTLLVGEFYHNGFGAHTAQELATATPLPPYPAVLTPHFGSELVAVSISQELTALLRGGYTVLHSQISGASSQLHQLTLNYSIADEADAQLAWIMGRGEGLDASGAPRSDFGHLPQSLYLRLQYYF